MTQPVPYSRVFDFTSYSGAYPTTPLPGVQVDAELNAARASLNAAIASLGLIQRDDGALANGSVTIDQIGTDVLALIGSAGFVVKGPWVTNTVYAPGALVLSGGSVYLAMTSHTSGATLAGDVTAGKMAGPVFSGPVSNGSIFVAPSGGDDGANIQAALNAASNAGGGTVYLLPGQTYYHAAMLIVPSYVILSGYGATLSYTGTGGVQLCTSTVGYTEKAGIMGVTLAFGSAAASLIVYSGYACVVRDITFTGTSYTNYCLSLQCNTTGPLNPSSVRNTMLCYFDNILCSAVCGTFIQLAGNATPGNVTAPVTLNTFINVHVDGPANGCCIYGIDFAQAADNNYFAGQTRINLLNIPQGANGVGMIMNSSGPTQNYGTYGNVFDQLSIDTFGTVTSDNRAGVVLNFSAQTKIGMYFVGAAMAGGSLVKNAYVYSYDITSTNLANNGLARVLYSSDLTSSETVNGRVSAFPLNSTTTTVSGLAAITAIAGDRCFVTDATQTMTAGIGAIVAGGGANKVPVYFDNTNWRIG